MTEFTPDEVPTHLVFLLAAPFAVLEPELLACLEKVGGRVLQGRENPVVLAVPIEGIESVDRIILAMEQCTAGLHAGVCRDAMQGVEIRLATLDGAGENYEVQGRGGQENIAGLDIVLETGRVFGSGCHPTTRLCMDALQELCQQPEGFPNSLLDVGCGSGVLAFAGIRLGARSALGIDQSLEAIEVARHNAELNGMSGLVRFSNAPLEGLVEIFPLVVANLPASVLLSLLALLAARVGRPGTLILSGAGQALMDDVSGSLKEMGFTQVCMRSRGSWSALVMVQ